MRVSPAIRAAIVSGIAAGITVAVALAGHTSGTVTVRSASSEAAPPPAEAPIMTSSTWIERAPEVEVPSTTTTSLPNLACAAPAPYHCDPEPKSSPAGELKTTSTTDLATTTTAPMVTTITMAPDPVVAIGGLGGTRRDPGIRWEVRQDQQGAVTVRVVADHPFTNVTVAGEVNGTPYTLAVASIDPATPLIGDPAPGVTEVASASITSVTWGS